MANILLYKVQPYSKEYAKVFRGVYDDFKNRSYTDYKFELAPLEYEDFIEYVEKGFIKCIILLEDEIPTAFLVYTTEISESIELNMIHCLGNEDTNLKRKLLMEKFMETEEALLKEKVTTYPMLGTQDEFTPEIVNYGFQMVGVAVVRFKFMNTASLEIFTNYQKAFLPPEFEITGWKDEYFDDVVKVVHSSFKNTSDAKFDPRFATESGSKDIVEKITNETYGTFLADCTSILLHKGKPVGVCFSNITAGKIGNIPIVGLLKEHCGKGFGEILLHNSVKHLLTNESLSLDEVNASTETDNYPALKMYRRLGFKEDYYYPQAFRPANA